MFAYYQHDQDKACGAVGRLTIEGIVVWCGKIMQKWYKGPQGQSQNDLELK